MAGSYKAAYKDRDNKWVDPICENMGDAIEAMDEMLYVIDAACGKQKAEQLLEQYYKEFREGTRTYGQRGPRRLSIEDLEFDAERDVAFSMIGTVETWMEADPELARTALKGLRIRIDRMTEAAKRRT